MPSGASPRATSASAARTILGHREFRLGRGPGAELLQRRLGVFADRHRAHVAGGDAAVAGELGEIEALADRDVADLGILRRDQHQLVAEQIDAGVVLDDASSATP